MQSTSKSHLGKICLQHRPSITQHPFLVTSPLQLKLYFIYFFISQYRHASRVILTIYITCISVRNRLWLLYIDSFIFPSQMYTQTRALYRLSPNILYIKNPFFFFIWVFFFLKDAQWMAREKKSLRVNNRQMGKGFFVCVIYCSGHELVYSIYTILLLIETFFLLFILSFFIVAIMTTFYIV